MLVAKYSIKNQNYLLLSGEKFSLKRNSRNLKIVICREISFGKKIQNSIEFPL